MDSAGHLLSHKRAMCWLSPTTEHTRLERSRAVKGTRTSQVRKGEPKHVTEGNGRAGKKGVTTEIIMRESEGEKVVNA